MRSKVMTLVNGAWRMDIGASLALRSKVITLAMHESSAHHATFRAITFDPNV